MPLDPNIILSGKPVEFANPMDAMGKAMQFKALANQAQLQGIQMKEAQQKFGDEQAMRNARAGAASVDSNGNVTYDQNALYKSLGQTAPHLLPEAQAQFAQMTNAQLKAGIERVQAIGQFSNGVSDEPSYQVFKSKALSYGADPRQFPEHYDPNALAALQSQGQSVTEHLKQMAENRGLDIRENESKNEGKKLDVELFKTFGRPVDGAKGSNGNITDPSKLVPSSVPPDRQAKVFDEISAAQNTSKSASKILNAFDNAAKEVRPLSGGLNTSMAAFVPGIASKNQKAFHALMGPTFQDVEGTVRQAAMDNMNQNVTPQFGDSDETVKTKRAALLGYLQSKSSAPTAMGYGIDLSKYPTTSIDQKVIAGASQKSGKSSSEIHPALKNMSIEDLQALEAKLKANSKVGQR